MFTAPAFLVTAARGAGAFCAKKRRQAGTCGSLLRMESLAGEVLSLEMRMEKIQQLC